MAVSSVSRKWPEETFSAKKRDSKIVKKGWLPHMNPVQHNSGHQIGNDFDHFIKIES